MWQVLRSFWYSDEVKVQDVIRWIESDGRVTVSGHPGDDLPRGTLASVIRQAGLKGAKR